MKSTVEFIIKTIVEYPEKVEIDEINTENATILRINANSNDIGKIIGKNGKIIKSLRAIAKAAAIKNNKNILIEIAE
ncbi:MAG: KH domain-containing protein [Atribacterota bacterium]|nr:KH domain-containing protein [Atribacterota bacterium]